ncbi:MAG: hypothetical protein QM328_11340 [Acidobacteriota bacterium]|nr:hypothetical protein [Acidobacteriota bacterium]
MAWRWTIGLLALASVVICASCAGVPASPGEGLEPPNESVVLTTGIGAVSALEIGDASVYALMGPPASQVLRSVPVAGGAASSLATGIVGAESLAPVPGGCVYANSSDGNAYLATPGRAPELVSKGFQGEVGPWVCSVGSVLCYARADGAGIASVGLSAPGGAGDGPVAPPQFLRFLGAAEGPELLAATESHVVFAHRNRAELARMSRQGGGAVAMNKAIGSLVDVAAGGSHTIAAGTRGVVGDGRTLSSRSGVVAVAVAGDRLLYATESAVYEACAAGESLVATGQGITQLAGAAGAVVFSDGASGGRLVRVTLTAD